MMLTTQSGADSFFTYVNGNEDGTNGDNLQQLFEWELVLPVAKKGATDALGHDMASYTRQTAIRNYVSQRWA